MKQQLFQQQFEPQWLVFEQQLSQLEGRPGLEPVDTQNFANDYRRLCHQLALARSRNYSPHLIARLNLLVLRGHQQLYRRRENVLRHFLRFVVQDFPRLIRREWRLCLVATLLFYLPIGMMGLLVWLSPELAYVAVGADMIDDVETMYNPQMDRGREAESDWMMFGFYIQNNIGIGFRTFAGGILLGIGSIFFLLFNGIVFGSLAGHIINIGYQSTFFSFVITHGAFELTAIAFAGAAGLKLGFALLSPGQYTRLQALRYAARPAMQIMYGVILMLLIAAFIEAFWSSSTLVEPWGKYLVGGCAWLFVTLYFLRMGRSANGS